MCNQLSSAQQRQHSAEIQSYLQVLIIHIKADNVRCQILAQRHNVGPGVAGNDTTNPVVCSQHTLDQPYSICVGRI